MFNIYELSRLLRSLSNEWKEKAVGTETVRLYDIVCPGTGHKMHFWPQDALFCAMFN